MTGRQRGFTLIELLIAVSLMALLAALTGSLLSNCRRIAAAAESSTERGRKEWVLRETLQADLDLSGSALTMDIQNDRAAGFSFQTYSRVGGKHLRSRVRYVFEIEPEREPAIRAPGMPEERASYQLVRYAIPDGIGVRESRDILLDRVDDPRLEAFSDAAGDFVPVERIPEVPVLMRITFKLRSADAQIEQNPPPDDIRLIVKNGHGIVG